MTHVPDTHDGRPPEKIKREADFWILTTHGMKPACGLKKTGGMMTESGKDILQLTREERPFAQSKMPLLPSVPIRFTKRASASVFTCTCMDSAQLFSPSVAVA